MPMPKKPTVSSKISKEAAADKFAEAAPNHSQIHAVRKPKKLVFDRVTLRVESTLMAGIDALALADATENSQPVNRNAYIVKIFREIVKRGGIAC